MAITVVLSFIYLYIRMKFKRLIPLKNAKLESVVLLISQFLLIVVAIVYSLLPQSISILIPILFISIFLIETSKAWLLNESLFVKIALGVLVILTLIPYVNLVGFIFMIAYLIFNGWKSSQLQQRLGLIIMAVLAFLTIVTKIDMLLWIGATIYYALNHIQHSNQLLSMLQNASENVITDALTGMYNRRWLYKKAAHFIKEQEIGIIFCDIDNFKILNDEQGHEQGDYVLQKSGEIMRRLLDGYGFACRYGGEELIGLVTDSRRSEWLAEKILKAVYKELNITMSIGVAVGQGRAEDLLKLADERMYISKKTGKNKVTFETEI